MDTTVTNPNVTLSQDVAVVSTKKWDAFIKKATAHHDAVELLKAESDETGEYKPQPFVLPKRGIGYQWPTLLPTVKTVADFQGVLKDFRSIGYDCLTAVEAKIQEVLRIDATTDGRRFIPDFKATALLSDESINKNGVQGIANKVRSLILNAFEEYLTVKYLGGTGSTHDVF